MQKVLSYVLSPIFYLNFGLALLIFHPLLVLSRLLFGRNGMDRMTSLFNLALMKLLWILGTNVKFKGFKKLPQGRPIVFLSNHQSMWDIPPLMWKFRRHHPKFIAKKELARFIPSVSFNINYGGSVAIDRSNPEQAVDRIRSFARYIGENNYSVCIFPEGSRSRDGKVKHFKKSGIEAMVLEMPNAIFVPIGIKNTSKIDYKGKFLKKLGVQVEFKMFGPRTMNQTNLERDLEIMRNEIKHFVEN